MKAYVLKFRSHVFEGAMSLFKRIYLPSILLNLLMIIVFLAITFLILAAFGISLAQVAAFNEKLRSSVNTAEATGNYDNMFDGIMENVALGLVFIMFLAFTLLASWMYYTFLKLNDNEVREGNRGVFAALGRSFASGVWSILGFCLLYAVLCIVTFTIYMFAVSMLLFIPILGVILAFLGYFAVLIFLLRFILALPAIVHGQMPVFQAFRFSFAHLTFKRAAMIFLTMLVCYVIFFIFILLVSLVLPSMSQGSTMEMSGGGSIIFLICMLLISTAFNAFAFSCLSALYFRYSSDDLGENEMEQHLVVE